MSCTDGWNIIFSEQSLTLLQLSNQGDIFAIVKKKKKKKGGKSLFKTITKSNKNLLNRFNL